ncbi:hypothetical protein [Gaetbulibacter aestuarii]|uniref:Uncharacterized protein n=1 Tax=Gaetbulibacter aestuarii TaxID=1502358 RepID=A0ABW7MYC8_9FLAO
MSYGGPYILIVSGEDSKITLSNIMLGEVWLCAGQSNMRFQEAKVRNAETEIKDATHKNIRF